MFGQLRKYGLLILFLALVCIDIFIFYIDFQNSHSKLEFTMFDIGQGDALFIQSPSGVQILVDSGPPKKILNNLMLSMSPFDKEIDAIIVTNPDADHIGGFVDVLRNYKVDYVLEPGTFNESKVYENLEDEIRNQNIKKILVKKGMTLDMGDGAVIEILFPDRDVSGWSRNDGSVVARLVYGETSIMLTGDSTIKTEKLILDNNKKEDLKSTILKVGHHGSRTSTSSSFVQAVMPTYALISDGKDNKYGHPHKETLDTLAKYGVQILRTDLQGTVIFTCDRIGLCEIKK